MTHFGFLLSIAGPYGLGPTHHAIGTVMPSRSENRPGLIHTPVTTTIQPAFGCARSSLRSDAHVALRYVVPSAFVKTP